MYQYLRNNGSLYQFQVPAPSGDDIKSKIRAFLQKRGNNKLLYMSGHGDRDGDLVVGEGSYLSPWEVFASLAKAQFAGVITFVIDACFAGMWVQKVSNMIHKGSRDPEIFPPLRDAAIRRGRKTYVNLRLSSLMHEESRDSNSGGLYTNNVLSFLRKEWKWTSQDGTG